MSCRFSPVPASRSDRTQRRNETSLFDWRDSVMENVQAKREGISDPPLHGDMHRAVAKQSEFPGETKMVLGRSGLCSCGWLPREPSVTSSGVAQCAKGTVEKREEPSSLAAPCRRHVGAATTTGPGTCERRQAWQSAYTYLIRHCERRYGKSADSHDRAKIGPLRICFKGHEVEGGSRWSTLICRLAARDTQCLAPYPGLGCQCFDFSFSG